MLTKIINFIFFTIVWFGLTGIPSDGASLMLGAIISFLTLLVALKLDLLPTNLKLKPNSIYYFFWLLKEILLSTITVIKISWQRNLLIHPVMRPIKSIQTTEIGTIIYANSITLTPGTVTLSVHDDIMMVHALDIQLMDDLEEGKMDRMVKEIIK